MVSSGRAAVGHPIDVATGTLFNYYQDFALRGLIRLSLVRYYSTALVGKGPGVLGFGFRHNYQHELRQSLEGFVYTDFEGNERTLIDDGSFASAGKLVFPAMALEIKGNQDRIELEAYGAKQPVLVFERRPGSRKFNLVSIAGHKNNRLDLVYDAEDRLRTVTQSRTGHVLTFKYDNFGRIVEVTFEAGVRDVVSAFQYDQFGDLVLVTDPAGVAAQYQYDQHFMTSESIRGGSVHEFRYDARKRCIQASGPNNYELRRLAFDEAAKTTFVTDSKGAVTTYQYNDSGQITAVTDPLAHSILSAYDSAGRLASQTNRCGETVAYHYDGLGHLQKVEFPDHSTYEISWADNHVPLTAQGPAGLVWKYGYDEDGLLIRSENPEGSVHAYTFDDFGQLTSVTTPIGATYRYYYDVRGYFVGFAGAQGLVTRKEVDARGNTTAVLNEKGEATRYKYDRFDRLIEQLGVDQQAWTYTYDTQGRLAREYAPTGEYLEYSYNTCGLVVGTRRMDGVVLTCDWDTEPGRILSLRDGNGNILKYGYDVLGRPIERTNWDGVVTTYEFDPLGRVSALTPADGSRQEFSYDTFGNVVSRRAGEVEVTFEYDANGFMIAALAADHELRWERDVYGRAVSEMQDGFRVEYAFDAGGRRASMLTALGDRVDYSHDIGSRLTQLSFGGQEIRFDYNLLGQELVRRFSGGGRFDRQYDARGRLEQEWFTPPGVQAGPRPGQDVPGQQPIPVSRQYTYSATTGHLDVLRDSLRGVTELTHDSLGQVRGAVRYWGYAEYYDFDAAGNRTTTARLTSGAPPPATAVFAPGLGARGMNQGILSALGADIETRAVGPGNRTTMINRANESFYYEFDAAGFLTRKTHSRLGAATEVWNYVWNVDGQLAEIVRPDGTSWKYEYDPLARRLLKVGPSGKTRFVWERRRLLHVLEDGQPPITLINDPVAFEPLMRKRGDDVDFVLPDHLAGVSELVGADGVLRWWRVNDAWGKSASGGSGEPGYAGQWLDAESGLFYNDHRYYDPELGRYISPDPIGLLGGWNEYGYVPSPFEGIDPHGLAKALGGGPMDYPAKMGKDGTPDIRGQRGVVSRGEPADYPNASEPPYGARTVPGPRGTGERPDGGGKCLAVTTRPDGKPPDAHVSGQGRAPYQASTETGASSVNTNAFGGNHTHAEIQALNTIQNEGVKGTATDPFRVFVDRPPCGQCEQAVGEMLGNMRENGFHVEVLYKKGPGEGGEWQNFDDPQRSKGATSGSPCH